MRETTTTMTTLDLFSQPMSPQEQAFLDFHKLNPHIYREVEVRAERLRSHGARRVGIAMIFEAMRYDHYIRTFGSEWKLNNSFRAYYARLLLRDHPELRDIVETRRSRADNMEVA